MRPTTRPPKVLKMVPIIEIPPFVPFGTFFKLVMRNGSPFERTVPNSEAHVSPLQQEKTPEKKKTNLLWNYFRL